jgi:hypothetical protein
MPSFSPSACPSSSPEEEWAMAFDELNNRIRHCFTRPELAIRAFAYVQGLMSDASRKNRVVLQKHEEKTKGRSFPIFRLYLNGYSEQCCDKLHLLQAISFAHSLYLSFSHHIYCFISL